MTRDTTALHVKVVWRENRVTVAVTGDVDLATAPGLSTALDEVIATAPRTVEVDLSETSFLACAGLSVLTRAQHRLAERGARLIVHGAVGVVRRVFTATGLHGLLTHDDAPTALWCRRQNGRGQAHVRLPPPPPRPARSSESGRTTGAAPRPGRHRG